MFNEKIPFENEKKSSYSLSFEKLKKREGKTRISNDGDTGSHQTENSNIDPNSRCVSVDTILIAPHGRNEKKERFKGKTSLIKFRCTLYQKKLLNIKAKRSGLSLSEFCRKSAMDLPINERMSDDHIAIYKDLVKFHNNFKSIGNMFRKRDPRLSTEVYKLAEAMKKHLKKLDL
jgi:hypothetical protein